MGDVIVVKNQSKIKTLYNWMVGISFGVILVFVVYCLIVYIFPPNVVDFKGTSLKILNEGGKVKRGERVKFNVEYCKYLPLEAVVETYVEDGVIWTLPSTKSNLATGCGNAELSIAIPREIPSGEQVRIVRELHFRTSPFTETEEILKSEYFTIVD